MRGISHRRPAFPGFLPAFVAATLACVISSPATAADASPIHLYVFLSETCPHCELVTEERLADIARRLDCRILPHYFDVDSLDEYRRLVVLEKRMGDSANELPVVFIGPHVLGGINEIEKRLEGLLKRYRDTGTAQLAVPDAAEAKTELQSASASPPDLVLAFFERPGCRSCQRAQRVLDLARNRHPGLEIRRFDIGVRDNRILLEGMGERAGLPPGRRLLAPALFASGGALVGNEITDGAVEQLLARARSTGKETVLSLSTEEKAAAERRIWLRARRLGVAAVLGGGLVDGVNPCAFATLVFLVCVLTRVKASRGSVLAVGGAFSVGVFVTYFLTGLGLREGFVLLGQLSWLSRVVTWGIIAFSFGLAAVSFRDYLVARRDGAEKMSLKLPRSLRLRINALIARRMRARWLVPAALGLGMSVSALEFACTGQVYFPLIRYITGLTASRGRAIGLLVLYNLAFVAPLVGVFVAVYCGLSSERLMGFFQRHAAAGKLALGVFFLALGTGLVTLEMGF